MCACVSVFVHACVCAFVLVFFVVRLIKFVFFFFGRQPEQNNVVTGRSDSSECQQKKNAKNKITCTVRSRWNIIIV
jgi:hypothetical protein